MYPRSKSVPIEDEIFSFSFPISNYSMHWYNLRSFFHYMQIWIFGGKGAIVFHIFFEELQLHAIGDFFIHFIGPFPTMNPCTQNDILTSFYTYSYSYRPSVLFRMIPQKNLNILSIWLIYESIHYIYTKKEILNELCLHILPVLQYLLIINLIG